MSHKQFNYKGQCETYIILLSNIFALKNPFSVKGKYVIYFRVPSISLYTKRLLLPEILLKLNGKYRPEEETKGHFNSCLQAYEGCDADTFMQHSTNLLCEPSPC